jgi:hypothetical protein
MNRSELCAEDAERAVLGSLLLYNQLFNDVELSVDEFSSRANKAVYRSIVDQWGEGLPFDPVTTNSRLNGDLDDYGGAEYVGSLIDGAVPDAGLLRVHCNRIRELAKRRLLASLGEQLSSQAPNANSRQLIESTRKLLDSLQEKTPTEAAFKALSQLEQGEIRMLIDNVLPEGIVFLGGLSASAKTWFCLSLGKALTTGRPFLNKWIVPTITPVLYLCPEVGDRAFGTRCRKMQLPNDRSKFLCRTGTDITLPLDAKEVLETVAQLKCVVILDTFVRFNGALDENSSTQNQTIVKQVQALRSAGAPTVIVIHHSPKSQKAEEMTLENVLRGSGDIGAAADVVYGLKTIDRETNEVQVSCVKARDIELVKPFHIVGRPYIDETGDFLLSVQPGEVIPTRNAELEELARIIEAEPGISQNGIFKRTGGNRNRLLKLLSDGISQYRCVTEDGKYGSKLYRLCPGVDTAL